MTSKIAVDKKKVAKPERNSVRKMIKTMHVNSVLTFNQEAEKQEGESDNDAANRTSQQLRNLYSRSVTDARQATGFTYRTNSYRKWETDRFVCYFEVIRTA
ncbi:hypothetical protein pEpSNUABM08_68 [Erwinia phage pEp_SNUABM_08]|uniref:Uncharacterized protein n=1 Tax=Erwinia phage pEp_SNUABM_08 TaxID=2593268 RepID=A0A5J6DBH7_9CAUD|nr:hypothetical protein JT353_gp68 [Erwinia phage pEp_SNUABM_08]QEQ94815.1 hypothetical protein pEpSNUABM08_68 [Erwinia phage pEp_SNUABM_08]